MFRIPTALARLPRTPISRPPRPVASPRVSSEARAVLCLQIRWAMTTVIEKDPRRQAPARPRDRESTATRLPYPRSARAPPSRPPSSYVRNRRVERALALMSEEGKSVSEAAKGLSPAAYLKELGVRS